MGCGGSKNKNSDNQTMVSDFDPCVESNTGKPDGLNELEVMDLSEPQTGKPVPNLGTD
jgi:hypothetical protein